MKLTIKKLEKNREKIHVLHQQLKKEKNHKKIQKLEDKLTKLVDSNIELIKMPV